MQRVRKIGALLALVLVLACQAMPVLANNTSTILHWVNDEANLLSADQVAELESRAQSIHDEYGIDVAIVTVPDMQGRTDAQAYAEMLYNTYGYGTGSDRSGILLMLSMQYRDYALIAHGQGNDVLTDYGNEKMADSFLKYFGEDDWAGGFNDYLDTAERYCHDYFVEGQAYDVGTANRGVLFVGIAIFSVAFGAITVSAMAKSMRTARKSASANAYIDQESGTSGLTLTGQSDDYIYSQTIVTHRPKPQPGPGSGGTTIGGGGFSGSSGKF